MKVIQDNCFKIPKDDTGFHDVELDINLDRDGEIITILAEGSIVIELNDDDFIQQSFVEDFRVYRGDGSDESDDLLIPFPGITVEEVADLMLAHCLK